MLDDVKALTVPFWQRVRKYTIQCDTGSHFHIFFIRHMEEEDLRTEKACDLCGEYPAIALCNYCEDLYVCDSCATACPHCDLWLCDPCSVKDGALCDCEEMYEDASSVEPEEKPAPLRVPTPCHCKEAVMSTCPECTRIVHCICPFLKHRYLSCACYVCPTQTCVESHLRRQCAMYK